VEELRGRNALVTGAAGGLGGYIARALAGQGVNVALSDLPAAPVDDLVEELRGHGVRAEAVSADLTDRDQLEALVGRAQEAIGPLDILVNNAGLEFAGSFLRSTADELEAILDVNLLATMVLTREALPGMQERGRGHIVNIASLAGKVPPPYLASYAATKHGVVGFTHALRAENWGEPVGFSAICPGFVSRVGMYGRLEHLVSAPRMLGTVPPESVGEAVVRAIRKNLPEVVVNKGPARPLILLNAVAPRLAARVGRVRPIREFTERLARAQERL
jgi:short-subunit dehydrogenase